jgi:hypothetical protein
MWAAEGVMKTLPNDPVALYDHSPHKGIRLGHPQSLSRQLKASAHIDIIFLREQDYGFILIFGICSKTVPH